MNAELKDFNFLRILILALIFLKTMNAQFTRRRVRRNDTFRLTLNNLQYQDMEEQKKDGGNFC